MIETANADSQHPISDGCSGNADIVSVARLDEISSFGEKSPILRKE
jgi:hypothetical protein